MDIAQLLLAAANSNPPQVAIEPGMSSIFPEDTSQVSVSEPAPEIISKPKSQFRQIWDQRLAERRAHKVAEAQRIANMTPEERELEKIKRAGIATAFATILGGAGRAGKAGPGILNALGNRAEQLTYQQAVGQLEAPEIEPYKPLLRSMPAKMGVELLTKLAGAAGGSTTMQRKIWWDQIQAMPETTEQERKLKQAAISDYYTVNVPGTAWERSPEFLEQRKAASQASVAGRIAGEAEGAGTQARTEATISAAKAAATEAAKVRQQAANSAAGLYDLSANEAQNVAASMQAIESMEKMADLVENGQVNYFSLTGVGAITDPKVYQLYKTVSEYYARPQSGAAITETEWKNFAAQLVNKNYMLTPEGRDAAATRLRQWAQSERMTRGAMLKDANWMNTMQTKYGQKDITEEEYNKLPSGSKYWYGGKQHVKK